MIPLIVACLVAVATARPEAGYSYPSPSGTYIQNSGSSGFVSGSSGFSSGSSGFSSGSSGFISGGNQASSLGYSSSSQVPLIHKHIYVHVAPPEPEVQQRQVLAQSAAPQKHYKIVFIKAPSFPTLPAPVISAQAQNQEKTLIYVLVKRPEDAPQISIPAVAPTQPSKPEVYFIKYKTQKETSISGPAEGGNKGTGDGRLDPNDRPGSGTFGGPGDLGNKGPPDVSKNNFVRGGSTGSGTFAQSGFGSVSGGFGGGFGGTLSQASYLPPSQSYGPPGTSGPY